MGRSEIADEQELGSEENRGHQRISRRALLRQSRTGVTDTAGIGRRAEGAMARAKGGGERNVFE